MRFKIQAVIFQNYGLIVLFILMKKVKILNISLLDKAFTKLMDGVKGRKIHVQIIYSSEDRLLLSL